MKFTVLVAFLALASLVSAAPMIKLGNEIAPFDSASTNISTVPAGGSYDLYVWASSDIALEADGNGDPVGTTGLDNFQVFFRYNTSLINLQSGLATKLAAVSENPFGTAWSGRSQGTFNGLGFVEGALLPVSNVGAFALTKIAKVTFTVAALGNTTTVSLVSNASPVHQTFMGNSMNQSQFFASGQSVTFIPEPAPPAPEPNIPPTPTPEPNVTPTPEPNVTPPPTPAPITQAHGAILVYKVSAVLSGYTFNPMTTPKTLKSYTASIAGFIVADVNTATLQTNYPRGMGVSPMSSVVDANSPSFIAVINNSLVTFNCADPNVAAAFDLARSDNPYCRMFNLSTTSTVKVGRTTTTKTTISTLIFPQFNFVYTRPADSSVAAFYDNQLMGNVGPVDIGMPAKASVPTAIVGSANFDMGQFHKVFGPVTLILDPTYTKLANKADYRVARTVSLIKSDLAKRYKAVSLSDFFAK